MPDENQMTPDELENFEDHEIHQHRDTDFTGPESERDTEFGVDDESEPILPFQNPD